MLSNIPFWRAIPVAAVLVMLVSAIGASPAFAARDLYTPDQAHQPARHIQDLA